MAQALKRTPLHSAHRALGARLTEFAGWEMPLQYRSILEEHRSVRSRAGIFDVSHLGRLEIRGKGATPLLSRVLTADIAALPVGRGQYSLLCAEDGGILDDAIVYRREEERYLLVGNAITASRTLEWLCRWAETVEGALVSDIGRDTGMLAFQGPLSARHLDALCDSVPSRLARFDCAEAQAFRCAAFIARTGYTGEDGFELVLASSETPSLWRSLIAHGIAPCGLGARDSLRLEAGFLLYGQDMDTGTNPYEAGLGRFVHLQKGDFLGREALLRLRESGVPRRLAGFEMVGRGIPRSGYPILVSGRPLGRVTSGGYAPTLDKGIGLGYLPLEYASPGSHIAVEIRGKAVEARVVRLPFYRPPAARDLEER